MQCIKTVSHLHQSRELSLLPIDNPIDQGVFAPMEPQPTLRGLDARNIIRY
ncbi:MAG: hypothetical protein ABJH28_10290 [Paraglaciecola sp.]|uniref:hypothetical protein n=1 Tax=Paraglaciecola sp. TaxID=1920173 RepID=UPI00326757EE